MADQSIQRRLVAILAADVKGYSRLMGIDEAATVAVLRGHRDATDRLIAEHDGRVANTAGDSIIAVFDSAVEAVRAALAIQAELAPLNAELSKERQMRFRIGVNLGDVIFEGDDVLGDGVNIAARLEGLAMPGGICISRNIYDQVSDKLHYTYDYLGEQPVKNIAQPVRAYRIVTAAAAPAPARTKSAKPKWAVTGGTAART
jgi:adenylate cyclase